MDIDVSRLHREYPHVWNQGYRAFCLDRPTTACPHKPISPIDTDKMNAWLSGWVTAQDDSRFGFISSKEA